MADIYLPFKAEMIKAYQEGRKTQTRRVIICDWTDRPFTVPPDSARLIYHAGMAFDEQDLAAYQAGEMRYPLARRLGERGDVLIMRESLSRADDGRIRYDADGALYSGTEPTPWPWQVGRLPAIYMPRWVARYTPRIVSVRVERLQDITDRDAEAEGVTFARREATWYPGKWRDGFAALWDRIHKSTGRTWATNPWVVVREFEKWQTR